MKKVLEKYKKLAFVYTSINLFALIVNVYDVWVEFEYYSFLLCYGSVGAKENIWPFVTFIRKTPHSTRFNGIFYQYDVSEFLLYMGIFVAFLVYKAYIVVPQIKKKVPSL